MKKIFIYYSETGNLDKVAEVMRKHDYEILKIESKKHLPKITLFKMMVGGSKALREHKEPLITKPIDISIYDHVVVATPIWNGRISSPINTVLDTFNLKDSNNLWFILSSGGGNAPKAVNRLLKLYPHSQITNICEPKEHIDTIEKTLFDEVKQ